MRVVNADALATKLRYMGYMDENEEVQEVIDRFAEECDGDLIYRQAAIDACIRVRELRAYDEIEEIKALPSAEPQVTVFCNLKDCSLNRNGVCSAECIIIDADMGNTRCLNYDEREDE